MALDLTLAKDIAEQMLSFLEEQRVYCKIRTLPGFRAIEIKIELDTI